MVAKLQGYGKCLKFGSAPKYLTDRKYLTEGDSDRKKAHFLGHSKDIKTNSDMHLNYT